MSRARAATVRWWSFLGGVASWVLRASGGAEGDTEGEHGGGIVELVPIQLAQLPHPVSNGLRVDEQGGGDVSAPALMQQPGAQCLGQLLGARRAQLGQRGQHLGSQVGKCFVVTPDDQLDKVLLGVEY